MNTRDEITHYLQQHPYSSADELSIVLGKTRANIQHHLKAMELANIITQVKIKPAHPQRGRPRAYYSLAPVNKPNNLTSLAGILLQILLDAGDTAEKSELLIKIAQQILPASESRSTLTQRLNRIVKELSTLGYQARWEAHADGPQVVFRNCPYHPLPEKYPILCRMDALLLMMNLDVVEPIQIAQIKIPEINACRFTIEEI